MSFQLLDFAQAEARLRELGDVPALPAATWRPELEQARSRAFTVETGVGVEAALAAMMIDQHPSGILVDAFEGAYPGLASSHSLTEHYNTLLQHGERSVEGFIHGLRGKLFELRLPSVLEERFPGFEFKLAESATQPGWDLVAVNAEGVEIFVQAKTGASSISGFVEAMQEGDAPHWFAVTQEVHDVIVGAHPELADRLIETDISTLHLDEEAHSALATVAENLDIDVPDALTDLLPYVGELVLGARLVVDIVRNEQSLAAMPRGDKNRLHGVRALTLMARFGVSTVLTTLGGLAGGGIGSFFPGLGNLIGSVGGIIGGAVAAGAVNRRLEPRLLDLGLDLAGLTKDDLFYFQNKATVDAIGLRLHEQAETGASLFGAAAA